MNSKLVFGNSERNSSAIVNETKIIQLLLKCGLFLQREMNHVCQRHGLKQQQFSVLNEIVWHGPLSQREIGEALLFEKSNVSKIVKILLEKEWIGVGVDHYDRRQTLLSETPEGHAVWQACLQDFQKSSREFTTLLSASETTDVIKLLKKLLKAFR